MTNCEYLDRCPGIKNYNEMLETLKSIGNQPAEKKIRSLMEKHILEYCSNEEKRKDCPHISKLEKTAS